jgi:hypothetical protein
LAASGKYKKLKYAKFLLGTVVPGPDSAASGREQAGREKSANLESSKNWGSY